ncbi:DUF4143 domain-containing protein [Bifidobacterium pullorum]|uniref:DUF4143 domain-containing protein n=1 Tax=Bifidobacterium pullorum TaxID=78448 RepID=UPI002B264985|nr:DUF4143 domain-containing protein [Bifidobacterium pullorum]
MCAASVPVLFVFNVLSAPPRTPKLYFHDTGLLCHLLGIGSLPELLASPYLGMVFENIIVAETMKRHCNEGKAPSLFFHRITDSF